MNGKKRLFPFRFERHESPFTERPREYLRALIRGRSADTPSGCWEWLGGKRVNGYGVAQCGAKVYFTHRLSYWAFTGDPLGSLHVCHKCDNPSCVNPCHLFLGTASDNMKDCVTKGRSGGLLNPVGEKNCKAKLDEATVRVIREIKMNTGISNRALAEEFGVSNVQIGNIVRGVCWAHIL